MGKRFNKVFYKCRHMGIFSSFLLLLFRAFLFLLARSRQACASFAGKDGAHDFWQGFRADLSPDFQPTLSALRLTASRSQK